MKIKTFQLTLLFNLVAHFSFSQVAIIQDKDGYTNVRMQPRLDASIVHQLKSNELFFFYEEYEIDGEWYAIEDTAINWVAVEIPESRFSFTTLDSGRVFGFIHKSRLLPIDVLPVHADSNIYLEFEFIPATKADIDSSSSNQRFHINGKEPYGLETSLKHSYAIKSGKLHYQDITVNLNQSLFDDLYNCQFEVGIHSTLTGRATVYAGKECFFIYQKCADGAGYYEVVWRIKNGKIVQRLVGYPY